MEEEGGDAGKGGSGGDGGDNKPTYEELVAANEKLCILAPAQVTTMVEFGEPGFVWSDSTELIVNPCVEIGLYPVDEETGSVDHARQHGLGRGEGGGREPKPPEERRSERTLVTREATEEAGEGASQREPAWPDTEPLQHGEEVEHREHEDEPPHHELERRDRRLLRTELPGEQRELSG